MADSKHDDYSSRHHSRAVIWSALIGSVGVIVAAWIGVSFGRGKGEDQRADLQKELDQREAEVAELRKEISDIRSAQEASSQEKVNRQSPRVEPSKGDQGGLAGKTGVPTEAQGTLPANSSGNVGVYNYQAKVAQLRVRGYGTGEGDQLQLVLEAISNRPTQGLAFSFLVENPENYDYDLRLSNPEDTALVLDDLHGEHKLVKAEGIRDNNIPLKVPAFSRRRFKLIFEPVPAGPQSISFQTVFVAKAYGNIGGEEQNRVKLDDISMARFR